MSPKNKNFDPLEVLFDDEAFEQYRQNRLRSKRQHRMRKTVVKTKAQSLKPLSSREQLIRDRVKNK